MLTPEISTDAARQQKWWADWRKVDFSWQALAKHGLVGGPSSGERTLQDYWRDNGSSSSPTDKELLAAGDIEKDPTGRLWHIAHVPLVWDDGSHTWKADPNHVKWTHFWEVLRKQIFALQREEFVLTSEEEPNEEKTEFAGVVFGRLPDDWEWHGLFDSLKIRFATCAFLEEVDFQSLQSQTDLELRFCLFVRRVDFDHSRIRGTLDLSDSTFVRQLSLSNAEISGNVKCNRIHCFGEAAILHNSIGGKTEISESVFYGSNGLEETTFAEDVTISYCRFLGLVSMYSVTFRQDAKIIECFFSADDLTFTGECLGDFLLASCLIEKSDVAYMRFHKGAYFSGTRFRQDAGFQNIDFGGKISFRNAVFESEATFEDVTFRGTIEFHNTVFAGVADLSRCSFPPEPTLFHGGFRGAEFRRVADFTNPEFFAWGAFAGTKFHQAVLFSPAVLRSDASFNKALAAAKKTATGAASANTDASSKQNTSDELFGELETAFQTLKVAMASQQARLEEQRFYRFELIARRRQARTPAFEKVFSSLYSVTSVYGTSLLLPLVWLAGLTLVFTLAYWTMTQTSTQILSALRPYPLRPISPDLINALTFSLRNIVQPFSAWTIPSGNSSSDEWAKALLSAGGPFQNLVTRLLGTVQSFVSPILLFLSGLAVKRRFQIT